MDLLEGEAEQETEEWSNLKIRTHVTELSGPGLFGFCLAAGGRLQVRPDSESTGRAEYRGRQAGLRTGVGEDLPQGGAREMRGD